MSYLMEAEEKISKKRDIVRQSIESCTLSSSYQAYYYDNLPDKVFYKAKKNYAGNVCKEDVLGLIDVSVFGSGKIGLLLSVEGIYYRKSLRSVAEYIAYKDIAKDKDIVARKLGVVSEIGHDLDSLCDVVSFGCNAKKLSEMVKKIMAVDRYTPDELIDKINDTVTQTDIVVHRVKETAETVMNVLECWMSK